MNANSVLEWGMLVALIATIGAVALEKAPTVHAEGEKCIVEVSSGGIPCDHFPPEFVASLKRKE